MPRRNRVSGVPIVSMLLMAMAAAGQSGRVVAGPFVPFVSGTSATVVWATESAVVKFGPAEASMDASAPAFQFHKTTLNGLKPGVRYQYEVPGAGKGSFLTPPAGDEPHTFVVFGDNRTRHEFFPRVATAIGKAEPDYIVHTGDQVENGLNPGHWSIFFEIAGAFLPKSPFFASLGNHEQNSPMWYQFFDRRSGYYSFDYGPIHWVILNTDLNAAAPDPEERKRYWREQAEWAGRDIDRAASRAKYIFLAFHHPPVTAFTRRYSSAAQVGEWMLPLLAKHPPDALFAGHDHNYQRHDLGGLPVIITGGGGAPLYPVDGPVPGVTRAAESVENFVIGKVAAQGIQFEARTPDGRVIDRFEIKPRR